MVGLWQKNKRKPSSRLVRLSPQIGRSRLTPFVSSVRAPVQVPTLLLGCRGGQELGIANGGRTHGVGDGSIVASNDRVQDRPLCRQRSRKPATSAARTAASLRSISIFCGKCAAPETK